MIADRARPQAANALTAAAIGQAMIAGGSLLARTTTNLPAHHLDTVSLGTFYGALVIGTGLCGWSARRLRTPRRRATEHDMPRPAAADPRDPADSYEDPIDAAYPTDPFVARLRDVIGDRPIAIDGEPVRGADGSPTAFTVRATKPGLFTNDRTRGDVYTVLTKSIEGTWDMHTDLRNDTLTFTVKTGFPSVAAPPLPTVVPQTANDARLMYPDFRMRLGVTASGESLDIDLRKNPHALVIGSTGSGKSAFARTVLESFRTAGWMLFLGDGKGVDYEGLHRQPGVVAISQCTADHVRLVRMVRDELMARQADAKIRRRTAAGDPFQRPPLLLLLDEYAVMRAQIKDEYGVDEFEEDMKYLTRVGREFKVHVIVSTQEAYRDTLPGQLLGNLNLRISLGPPADKTIKEAFPESLRNEAARIGGTISKNDRGRSLAVITDDEGTNQAVEFQAYYGYSPAETKPAPTAEIAAQWDHYRSVASDRIPLLYPRLWFAVECPEYGDDLDALYRLPVVVLTGRDGDPLAAAAKYDPLSDHYLGGVSGGGSVFRALDELPDVIDLPQLPEPVDIVDDPDEAGPEPAVTAGPEPAATAEIAPETAVRAPVEPTSGFPVTGSAEPFSEPKRTIVRRNVGI